MKKFLLFFTMLMTVSLPVLADGKQDAYNFFNKYVNAANTYDTSVGKMYSPNAKIIRQVVKPDGTTANAYTDTATYLKQMRISQGTAKLRKYKNTYRNITVTPTKDGGYKISAERQPTGETYWLKTYQIIKKQPDGSWLITEEMMQTKQQIFLRYVKDEK